MALSVLFLEGYVAFAQDKNVQQMVFVPYILGSSKIFGWWFGVDSTKFNVVVGDSGNCLLAMKVC